MARRSRLVGEGWVDAQREEAFWSFSVLAYREITNRENDTKLTLLFLFLLFKNIPYKPITTTFFGQVVPLALV